MTDWELLRSAALLRDAHECAAHGLPVTCWGKLDPHHLWRRSQGGPDVLANLVTLRRSCHSWVHDHPLVAQCLGLLVPSWTQMEGVAVSSELRQRARHRLPTFAPWLTEAERAEVWEQLPAVTNVPLATKFPVPRIPDDLR